MRNFICIFSSIAVLLFFSAPALAQEKPKTEITYTKQKGDLIRLSLTSSKPFIFGSNTYVLYIGNKDFRRNEQSHKKGKGYMTFLIPAEDFDNLQEGADIYLTYGRVNVADEDMQAMAANSRRCWSLGKFSKNILTK